jgi:hypothetical protein
MPSDQNSSEKQKYGEQKNCDRNLKSDPTSSGRQKFVKKVVSDPHQCHRCGYAFRRCTSSAVRAKAAANVHEIERQWLALHHRANTPRKQARTRATPAHRYKPPTRKVFKEIRRRMAIAKARRVKVG